MKRRYDLKHYPKVQMGLFSFTRFVSLFLILGFAISCSFMLFLSGLELSEEFIREKAPVTFFNVLFVCFLLTVGDVLRRKLTIERSVKKILYATQKISEGDFSVRIKTKRFAMPRNELDVIIKNITLNTNNYNICSGTFPLNLYLSAGTLNTGVISPKIE